MAVDYRPVMGEYTELKPFRFWCQKILPLVYDDSLSYYELLCKVVDYLNKTMEDVETLHDDVENLSEAYDNLQSYVNDYFDNLDVQEEINNKLDAMALDGSLSSLVSPLLPNVVSAWLSEHLTPTTPVIDNSLTTENAGADAKKTGQNFSVVYDSTKTYKIDDIVLYNGNIYRCVVEIKTAESFNSKKWAKTSVKNEVEFIRRALGVEVEPIIVSNNVFNIATAQPGYFFTDGLYYESDEWVYSEHILLNEATYVSKTSGVICFFTENDVFISASTGGTTPVAVPNNAYYCIYSCVPNNPLDRRINLGNVLKPYDEYTLGYSMDVIKGLEDALNTKVNYDDTILPEAHSPNIFNPSKIVENYFINQNGRPEAFNGWFYSEPIPIEPSTTYRKNSRVAVYDSSGTMIDYNAPSQTTMTTGATASYCMITDSMANLSTRYLIKGSELPNDTSYYVKFDKSQIYGLDQSYIIDKNGNGDYTSLAEFFYNHKGEECTIYVRKGTYNLIDEYKALFGDDYFANYTAPTASNMGEGLPVNHQKIYLDSDATILFDYTGGDNTNVSHYFSCIKFEGNSGEIHGGRIIGYNCRYAIHDDVYNYGGTHSHSVIDGCYIYRHEGVAIGGGCGRASTIEVKNCYVENGSIGSNPSGWGLFYHNCTVEGVQDIHIHNNYVKGKILIESFGPSLEDTSVAYVSNNFASGGVEHVIGDTDNNIRNIKMLAWNNATS